MTEAQKAMKNAQAKHLARLTGPQTCCVKVGPDNMPCGEPVEYRQSEDGRTYSGWRHVGLGYHNHHAVPASYAR